MLEVLEEIVMGILGIPQLNAQMVLLLSVLHCVQNEKSRVSLGMDTVLLSKQQPVHLILFVSRRIIYVINV